MFLSGKDLLMYRLNQIKTLALMISCVAGMLYFLTIMFITYC